MAYGMSKDQFLLKEGTMSVGRACKRCNKDVFESTEFCKEHYDQSQLEGVSDIGWAISQLKNDQDVRRKGWGRKHLTRCYDYERDGRDWIKNGFVKGLIFEMSVYHCVGEWVPTFEDLLATDWEIYRGW